MPDRQTRKKQITIQRQQQILGAALEVFSQKGYAAATIPQIAGTAGLAAGTIYLYYPSKRDLFLAVIENLIVAPLGKIFADEKKLFTGTLKEALEDRLGILQSDLLPRFLSIMGEIQRDAELREIFTSRLVRPFLSRMEDYYQGQPFSGGTGKIDPFLLVRMIGGMIIGLTVLKGLEGETSPLNRLSREEAAEQIQKFILYGLMGQDLIPERRIPNERQRY